MCFYRGKNHTYLLREYSIASQCDYIKLFDTFQQKTRKISNRYGYEEIFITVFVNFASFFKKYFFVVLLFLIKENEDD